MTNREFSTNNKQFREACEKANVQPTKRQASRWRQQRGSAWKVRSK